MGCRPLPAQKKEPKDKASRPLEEEEKKKINVGGNFSLSKQAKNTTRIYSQNEKKSVYKK